jgi:Cof subfamily protein (haloacid dehalogenase superfamily)
MLVSDVDETLLNNDGTINQLNVDAIKKAASNGFKFVPNTGRSFNSVQDLLEILGLRDQINQYVISYNGAAIIENKNNAPLITRGMDFNLAQKVFELGLVDNTVDAHIYTLDTLFIYNISPTDKTYMAQRGVPYKIMVDEDWSFLKNEAPIMKVIFEHPDKDVQKAIYQSVMRELSNEVEGTFSSSRYVEFNTKGVDKGSASLLLGEKLGINPDEIIAVGDNNNDLSMIKAAGLGVSVANGIPEVKDAADYVTKSSNNQGAIAEILEKFV